jgi:hypothetical protein
MDILSDGDPSVIFDSLSVEEQRKLLKLMDDNKRLLFIRHLTCPPVILQHLSIEKLTIIFENIQRRIHIYRPHSVTFKDTTIVFNIPDYKNIVTIHETNHNFIIKHTSILIRIRVLSKPIVMSDGFVQTITHDRFPKDSMMYIQYIDDVYFYIDTLDRVFLTMYGILKTEIFTLIQNN